MSVLIKGMKMPQHCYECDFEHYNRCEISRKASARVESIDRPEWCPLVEVPTPHGRLIDADKLLKHKTDHEMIDTHFIWNAPTVIESEE